VRVWEEAEGGARQFYKFLPSGGPSGLMFSRDSRFMIAYVSTYLEQVTDSRDEKVCGVMINTDRCMRIWTAAQVVDIISGEKRGWLKMDVGMDSFMGSADFSDDGLFLRTGTYSPRLWDVKVGREIKSSELKGIPAIHGLRHIAFRNADDRFEIRRTGHGSSESFKLPSGVKRVLMSPDGESFVTSDSFVEPGVLRIWRIRPTAAPNGSLDAVPVWTLAHETPEEIFSRGYSPKGRYLLTLQELGADAPTTAQPLQTKTLRLRSSEGKLISSLPIATRRFAADFSPDESRLVILDQDFEVLVVSTSNGEVTRRWKAGLPVCRSCYVHVAMSADGEHVAVAGVNEVSVWEIKSGRRVSNFTYPAGEIVNGLVFSPEEKYLLVVTTKQVERVLWKVSDLEREIRTRLLH